MTAQETRNDSKQPHTRRCNVPCPQRLSGNLGPFKCRLEIGDGGHTGDHKAHMMIRGLGKVVFRWKNTTPRPEVSLKAPVPLKGRRPDTLI